MSETALVFPGQGSQRPGMARDFHDGFPSAREIFAEASEAAGFDVAALSFSEDDRLNRTEFTQPCILTAEVAMLRVLREQFGLSASLFAGHSLGEYTALVAAGCLRVGEAARLVRRRGALMQEAVPAGEGAMLAVVGKGLDLEEVQRALEGLEADAANHNSSAQIVISGRAQAVETARERLVAPGRRLVPLNVSAPFHSRLMRDAEPPFAEELAKVTLDVGPGPQVASNFTGGFHVAEATSMRESLVRQLSGTVRWVDNMRALSARASRIVEIGPGRPLSGFFKDVGVTVEAVVDRKSAERVFAAKA